MAPASALHVAIDATYAVGEQPTGIGVYGAQLIAALRALETGDRYVLAFRMHRFLAGLRSRTFLGFPKTLLTEWGPVSNAQVYHALNQRLPRRPPQRSVVTFHDLFVLTAEYSSPEFRARFEQQARHAAADAACIIAVSQFTADQVAALLGIPTSRIRVVHHGIAPPAPQMPDGDREPIVLHVGVLQTRKNIVRLVQAFEALPPQWRLVLAGGTEGHGAKGIVARIEQSPARDRIDLTGYISPVALEHLYSRASVFAFPSLDEGFGLPVLEAMARGVPVLTSNRSALPEVAGDAALLVDPLHEESIAAGLQQMCSDEDLRTRLSQLGRIRAANFTWESAASATREIYRELA